MKSSSSLMVKTIARVVTRLMLIFGLYVVAHGQVTHGGGFAGGVIIALVFILLMLSFGKEVAPEALPHSMMITVASSGALLLLAIAAAGLFKGAFFMNFLGTGEAFRIRSGGIIPLCNIAITFVVAAALYGIFAVLISFKSNGEKKMTVYILCLLLFCIGLYGVLRKRNVIKMIIGIMICEYAANLFLILIGYRLEGRAPILSPGVTIENMVDPLPQAVVLTTIVIGLATTALLVAIAIRIYEKYGTFDITKINDLKG